MTEQIGPYVGNQTPAEVINFGLGQPTPLLLPRDLIASAAERLAEADPLLLQYGTGRGYVGFREALAEFLSERHGLPVGANDVAASGSISLTLSFAADVFARRHGVIACEDPTYFLARGVFESAGAEVVGIPMDADGLDVERLAQRLDAGLEIDALYTIPAHQNPTGLTLSTPRRERLVELAVRHDFVIFADEPYNLLDFGEDGRVPPPLVTLDGGRDRVLSISSFTKILAPGLRFGWVHAPRALMRRLFAHGVFRSGGAINPVISYVVEGLLRDGRLATHLDETRDALARRATALCDALQAKIPEAEFARPGGGYFVWLRLPAGVSATALAAAAAQHGVAFVPGPRCAVEAQLDDRVRLSFSFYDEMELAEGVDRLAAAIGALRA